jgi:hypothetical protein
MPCAGSQSNFRDTVTSVYKADVDMSLFMLTAPDAEVSESGQNLPKLR